jgi:hypothetical protein
MEITTGYLVRIGASEKYNQNCAIEMKYST